MADVAEALQHAFSPRKINYELLGNTDDHLHWWLIPRHLDDPDPKVPIWLRPKEEIFGPSTKPSGKAREEMVERLRTSLEQVRATN